MAFLYTTLVISQETYTIGKTEYFYNQTYSTTGKPMVKRSESNKKAFLLSKGYGEIPNGFEIDHIIPLSHGGSDDPTNMQLLTVLQHRAKTARERSSTSTSSYSAPLYSGYKRTTVTPTYRSNSTYKARKTYYTGPKGGSYYYNSNGNKTYVKRKIPTYSTSNYQAPSYYSTPTYNSNSSRTLQTGPRGGTYYINSNGNKTYVKKN